MSDDGDTGAGAIHKKTNTDVVNTFNTGDTKNSNTSNTDSKCDHSIAKVSVKVPPFWPDRPALWFASLEAQFHINNITQEKTKFYYAISQLDNRSAAEAEEIIIRPPAENPYTKLKEALISRFSESREEKIRRLLEKEDIGDRKPSAFLRHLKSLADGAVPEPLLQTIWMSRLTSQIQSILIVSSKPSLDERAELADQLYEVANTSQVRAVSANYSGVDNKAGNSSELDSLKKQLEELTLSVASLSSTVKANYRRPRSRSRPRYQARRNESLCWYHDRFGKNAQRCNAPCNWPTDTGKNQGSQ